MRNKIAKMFIDKAVNMYFVARCNYSEYLENSYYLYLPDIKETLGYQSAVLEREFAFVKAELYYAIGMAIKKDK